MALTRSRLRGARGAPRVVTGGGIKLGPSTLHIYACYAYASFMPSVRTTIVLDERSRLAAKTLARKLGVTPAEATRRALLYYRDQVCGVSAVEIARRKQEFAKLMELMDGNDAEAEIRRLKQQDAYF